ncbi:MAG: hypothetical protein JW958_05385 [Candidatus Eisenbacteria bacterium]|nr:hypothetical protein [Candidatus Eisenbacteria bacterium]
MPTDPGYLFNPGDVNGRVNFYRVTEIPKLFLDGTVEVSPWPISDFGARVRAAVDTLLLRPSPLRIHMTQTAGPDSVRVLFDVAAPEDPGTAEQRLFLAVTEICHDYGGEVYRNLFRDFLPDSLGRVLHLAKNDSVSFDWSYPIDPEYEPEMLVTALYLQDPRDFGVFQAASDAVGVPTRVATGAPAAVRLLGNAPNPFNPTTTVRFAMDRAGPVRLSVIDPAGRLVTVLLNRSLGTGEHAVTWDGRDRSGRPAASGVYLLRLEGDGASGARKMTLLR